MSNAQTEATPKKGKKLTAPPPTPVPDSALEVKPQGGALAVSGVPFDPAQWAAPDMTAKDIIVPRILAMQGMTKAVMDNKAKFGEFRETLHNRLLGDTATPFEFLPFLIQMVYVVMKLVPGSKDKFKFSHQVPITAGNTDHEYEVRNPQTGILEEKWMRTWNVFVLLTADIENGTAIPHLLSLRSSSGKAGQKIFTTMYVENAEARRSPAAMTMKLSGIKTSNDQGTFVVADVEKGRPATAQEEKAAFRWVGIVAKGKIQVDSEADEETYAPGQAQEVNATELSNDY